MMAEDDEFTSRKRGSGMYERQADRFPVSQHGMPGSLRLCRRVTRQDVPGEFSAVIGKPPVNAEEATRRDPPDDFPMSAMSGCAFPFH